MIKTLALVLNKQNIGETDRILTLLSPTLGKKRVIVRAVRRPLSRLAGHLDTLMLSQLILTDDPDLPKVTSAQLIEPFVEVRQNLEKSSRAQIVSRLVERVTVEDISERSIFRLTVAALTRLDQGSRWPATWLAFLFGLAGQLGVRPPVAACHQCAKPLCEDCIWNKEERCFYCSVCANKPIGIHVEANEIKLLQLLERQPFTMIERIDIPDPIALTIEQILLEEITQWLNKPWQSYAGLARN